MDGYDINVDFTNQTATITSDSDSDNYEVVDVYYNETITIDEDTEPDTIPDNSDTTPYPPPPQE